MAKFKLDPIQDDKPVRLTVELRAALHRDLVAYAEVLAHETMQKPIEPAKLIAPMVARFIATDRRLRQDEAEHLSVNDWQQIAFAEDLEDIREGRILIVRPPMRGVADPGRLGAITQFAIDNANEIRAGARLGQEGDAEAGPDQALEVRKTRTMAHNLRAIAR
jgi:hypothetical protein